MNPALWRSSAERDAAEAAYWYGTQAGLAVGERFMIAVESGIAHRSQHPASGSLRHALPLNLDGMPFWPVDGFPYQIFCVERDTHLDVWRVLHAQRDVPAWMGGNRSEHVQRRFPCRDSSGADSDRAKNGNGGG